MYALGHIGLVAARLQFPTEFTNQSGAAVPNEEAIRCMPSTALRSRNICTAIHAEAAELGQQWVERYSDAAKSRAVRGTAAMVAA